MKYLVKTPLKYPVLSSNPINNIPTQLGKTVELEVITSGICRTDIYVSQDKLKPEKPLVLGHEFCGRVIQPFSNNYSKFSKDELVAVNPIFSDTSMLGVNYSGSFGSTCTVPIQHIYKVPQTFDPKLIAYVEPIAAALAPLTSNSLSKNSSIAVIGLDRIGSLVQLCLKLSGYDSKLLTIEQAKKIPDNSYDIVIETIASEDCLWECYRLLKPESLLILRSRPPSTIPCPIYQWIKKALKIEALFYMNFKDTITFIESNNKAFNHLLGECYPIDDWSKAFTKSASSDRKIFLY